MTRKFVKRSKFFFVHKNLLLHRFESSFHRDLKKHFPYCPFEHFVEHLFINVGLKQEFCMKEINEMVSKDWSNGK